MAENLKSSDDEQSKKEEIKRFSGDGNKT